MAEGKGKWTSVFQTGGNRFIIRNERRADVASIPTKVEGAADYANLIVTAVNTYPAVEGLVKALGSALNELTACARQLNAKPRGSVMTAIVRGRNAAARFRSLQNGGANE